MESEQTEKKRDEKSKSESKESLGLTTSAALKILQRDIKRVLDEYEEECKKNKYEFFSTEFFCVEFISS